MGVDPSPSCRCASRWPYPVSAGHRPSTRRHGARLATGEQVRVRGSLAGRSVEFLVDVAEADGGRLALSATGPIRLDVEYRALALDDGSDVQASVDVSGRGLVGGLLARATD